MGKSEFKLNQTAPIVEAGYSGNALDPAKAQINKALGCFGAIPPYFFLPKKDIITTVNDADRILEDYSAIGVIHSQMPLRVKRSGDKEWFTFPIEPLVSISGKNVITRRTVAKSKEKGTVKERWSQDDYDVTIQGVVAATDKEQYPKGYIKKLLGLFNERQAIEVEQEILLIFGIKYLAIENASFPHTKGIDNQNFEIKAYSDNPVDLLISI